MKALPREPRDLRIDFARGIALLIIYTDHVVENPLAAYTPARFGFSDMAEVFVFLSGFVCGLVYVRILDSSGFCACQKKAIMRASQLYVANCAMTTFAALIVWKFDGSAARFLEPSNAEATALVRSEPARALVDALTFRLQGTSFLILPLYFVLIVFLPAMLVVWKRNPLALLLPSILVYANVQIIPDMLRLPRGLNERWYFNPLAWQCLFVIGVHFGALRSRKPPTARIPTSPWLTCLAVSALALSAAALRFGAVPIWPYEEKDLLGPLRLLHFGAVVIVARTVLPSSERVARIRLLDPVIACGQCSLATYCGSGLIAMAVGMSRWNELGPMLGAIVVNVGGWAACCLIALIWRRTRAMAFPHLKGSPAVARKRSDGPQPSGETLDPEL
jgi:hypothetical protein